MFLPFFVLCIFPVVERLLGDCNNAQDFECQPQDWMIGSSTVWGDFRVKSGVYCDRRRHGGDNQLLGAPSEAELLLKAGTEHQITAACKTNLDTHVHKVVFMVNARIVGMEYLVFMNINQILII
jgi:hypothetical protein